MILPSEQTRITQNQIQIFVGIHTVNLPNTSLLILILDILMQ